MSRCCAILVLIAFTSVTTVGASEPPLPALGPGRLVQIRAPKTIHIPGVFTASEGRIEWHARQAEGDTPLLMATNDDWPEPIAAPRPGATMRGLVVSTDATGIVLQLVDGRRATVRIPEEAIDRLEVSQGRRSRVATAAKGAGMGLLTGAVVGAIIGSVAGDGTCYPDPNVIFSCLGTLDNGDMAVLGAAGLGLVGLVLGGSVGAVSPGERWQRVRRDRPRVNLTATGRHHVGVQVSVPF